jgi:hypothetical protein
MEPAAAAWAALLFHKRAIARFLGSVPDDLADKENGYVMFGSGRRAPPELVLK